MGKVVDIKTELAQIGGGFIDAGLEAVEAGGELHEKHLAFIFRCKCTDFYKKEMNGTCEFFRKKYTI